MKTVTAATYDTITKNYHNEVGTEMRAEWLMNKYFKTAVDNTPTEDEEAYDLEYFPIESITQPNRPTSGICKAMVNQAYVEPDFYSTTPDVRYYTVDADDEYKYWQSPVASDNSGNITKVAPQVFYTNENDTPTTVKTNKIHFTVENSFSYPVTMDVQIKATSASSWVTVANQTHFTIPEDGKVELYWNGSTWRTTKVFDKVTSLHGVRLVVTKMYVPPVNRNVAATRTSGSDILKSSGVNFSRLDIGATVTGSGIPAGTKIIGVNTVKGFIRKFAVINGRTVELKPEPTVLNVARLNKKVTSTSSASVSVSPVASKTFFNLIELGLALELDLTPDLISWSDNFNMGEADFITPLGTISSNDGSVELWNGDNWQYRNNYKGGILYGLLDKGVKFTCWMRYGSELVQEFEMFSEEWNETDDSTSVQLADGSKFLMEAKPRPVLYRKIPIQEAVWRICDIVGFNKYNVTEIDDSPEAIIDIFWTDPDKTVWEIFTELSKATQTAIYFDSYGVLQVRTRNDAWNSGKSTDYSFVKNTEGEVLANIESLSEKNQYEANKVTVSYQETGFSEKIDNIIPVESVWEPEGSVVLRATPIVKNLDKNDNVIYLEAKNGKTWPFKGIMNIEGEWISYEGKRYVYYDSGTRKVAWVKSLEQQKALDAKGGAFYRHKNSYTGALLIEDRGLWGTDPKAHKIDLSGWTKVRRRNYTTNVNNCGGIGLDRSKSMVQIKGAAKADYKDYTYLRRGAIVDQGCKFYGFRMKVDKSTHKTKQGGLFFAGGQGLGSGYYVELTASAALGGVRRNKTNEIMLYAMKSDGSKKVIGGEVVSVKDKSKGASKNAVIKYNKGAAYGLAMNQWIDIDIWVTGPANAPWFQIFANGKLVINAGAPDGWKFSNTGYMGLYARGHSSVSFDYFYGMNSPGVDKIDAESYYDRVTDGFYSTQQVDWQYETRRIRRKVKKKKKWATKKVTQRFSQRIFEEFGPVAHEIREFDVKFTADTPVLQSRLSYSPSAQVVVPEYTHDITGAKFLMANVSRTNVIVHGDNAKMMVYGRPVKRKDAQTIKKEDEWSLRRRGPIEVEYNSPWIQNKSEATKFANWLATKWSRFDGSLEVTVFGNPLVELGDLVSVKYDHIDAHFYVVGVQNAFNNGLSSSLTLRKAFDN